MPRRRPRTTSRKRRDERRLRVRGVRRDQPDAVKLSRAFIALALAKAEADAQAEATAAHSPTTDTGKESTGEPADSGGEEVGDVA